MERERARIGDTFLNAHCGSLLHPFTLCYACASLLRFLLSPLLFFFALLFLLPSIGLSVFFSERFQNYPLVLHSHSCSTVRMALFVYISIAIWPTVPGNKQTPCGNIAFEELLHVSDDRCPHPSLGQVFVCILYVTRKAKSCRDTSVLDSRNINSHLFAFTI